MDGKTRVAAAVIEEDGRVLIARRRKDDRFGGLWEFPGGKTEPGELPEEALIREIREELGVEIRVGALLGVIPFRTAGIDFELLAFRTFRESGTFACLDHEEIRWVDVRELSSFPLTEPDSKLVAKIFPIPGGLR